MKIKNIQNGIRLENETGFIDVTVKNDRWITVHPNGEDEKGRHLLLEGDETPKEAMKRQWGVDLDKNKDSKAPEEGKKEESKDEPKEEKTEKEISEPKNLEEYMVRKKEGGFMASTKETRYYENDGKSAEIEDNGQDGYRMHLYVGGKTKEIKYLTTKRGMEKALREHLEGQEKPLEKTNLDEKRQAYQDVLKRYQENDEKRWHSSGAEYYKAYDEAEKAKKELTKARREYAESIMANFEEANENPYEERQQARKERYEELSEKAQQRSDEISQSATRKFEAIPFGQPIHGASDRNYREKAWAQFGRSVEEGKKADYYAQRAESVGKAGISSDDANAIAKLAQKYNSGAIDSAEKRRIIDRVIEIDKRNRMLQQSQGSGEKQDYSDLGFDVERNAGINRLQLKFSGIPSGEIRAKLKSYGFRWSPRESAWQRQLGSNSEYSFKKLVEELRKNNA